LNSAVVRDIRDELKRNADEATRISSLRFFKEEVGIYGIKTAVVKKIAKHYYKEIKTADKAEIFRLCEELWRSGYLEESSIACEWSYLIRKDYEREDFPVFERWVALYVTNWASCDTLCNHSVGAFIEMYPEYLKELKRWALSENRWVRRASAVSLIVPARSGKFLADIFEIADILLTDRDDLVQKGYGWMLKAASHAHEREVFDYVMKNKDTMPRTALRYAIEKMPKELKAATMERSAANGLRPLFTR
jgi:3-methyladenine DNA glycosylase AlkD